MNAGVGAGWDLQFLTDGRALQLVPAFVLGGDIGILLKHAPGWPPDLNYSPLRARENRAHTWTMLDAAEILSWRADARISI